MRKIKIAQIGIGHDHAGVVLMSLRKQTDIFEVVGVHIPENEKKYIERESEKIKDLPLLTLEEILDNPEIEAVTIETEELSLSKYAILAFEKGKHVHMDKPGGAELCDFEKLIETARKNKLVFHTGYMYRYNPELLKIKEDIKNGVYGEIYSVEAHMSGIFPQTSKKCQWLEQFKGGMMFFLGCHLIDAVIGIMGLPERVVPFNKCTGIDGVTSTDYGMAVLEYKNGVSFVKTCAQETFGFSRRNIVICGSKKTIEIRPIERYEADGMHAYVTEFENNDPTTRRSDAFDRYASMMSSFAAMARGEKENPYTYDYELDVYKTVLKACGVN